MILKENILSKITKLPQDPDKTSHSHTIQHSFRVLSVCLSVQLRLPQTELIPHLQPHQRHLPLTQTVKAQNKVLFYLPPSSC